MNAADVAAMVAEVESALPRPERPADRYVGHWYRGLEVESIERPPQVVSGLIAARSLTVLVGKWKTLKSFCALDLALSIATGRPWCDRDVAVGRVVYCLLEGTGDVGDRVKAWRTYHGFDDLPRFELCVYRLSLLNGDDVAGLIDTMGDGPGPVLVVVDTLARAIAGGDENGPDMGRLIDACGRITDATGAAVLLVHHQGHSTEGRSRGHSSLPGAVDLELVTERSGDTVTLRNTLTKYYPEAPPITLRAVPHNGTLVVVHDAAAGGDSALTDSAALVLRTMRDAMSGSAESVSPTTLLDWVTDAALMSGSRPMTDRTLRRALKALSASDLVRACGTETRPRYSLTEPDTGHQPDITGHVR